MLHYPQSHPQRIQVSLPVSLYDVQAAARLHQLKHDVAVFLVLGLKALLQAVNLQGKRCSM